MTSAAAVLLLFLSGTAFGAAGACAAIQRKRVLEDGAAEAGFTGILFLLTGFGALCAAAVGGGAAVPALGLPVGMAGYAFTAQRIGLFRIQTDSEEAGCTEGSELHT